MKPLSDTINKKVQDFIKMDVYMALIPENVFEILLGLKLLPK